MNPDDPLNQQPNEPAPAPGLGAASAAPAEAPAPPAAPPDTDPAASHALLGRLLGKARQTQIGRMVDRYQQPAPGTAVKRLHQDLKGLAQEGEPGRMWYEKSSKRILDYVQGNRDEAHKIAQLVAIYSPQTGVPTNTANAIKAYNRAKTGQPMWAGDIVDRDKSFDTIKGASDYAQSLGKNITKVPLDDSGKRFLFARHNMGGYENIATADRDLKAHLLMNEGIPFEGRKTNNFYRNLMVHIDPTIDQGSTQDLWMARAFGFHDDAVSNATKYDFMEKLTHKLGKELGWKPHQVQAAIWTAMKTRQEATKEATMKQAVDQGLAEMVQGDKGKPKFTLKPGQEDAYSSLQRENALGAVLDADHIKRSARDFSDFLDQNLAHVSWEATPSRSVDHMRGLSDLSPEKRADYHKRISEALQDEQGNDLLAKHLGMLSPGTVEAPGYWQGDVNPASRLQVAATRIKAAGQRPDIDTASKELMDTYANARGLLLKQDGVGYHRPFYNPKVTEANGVEYQFEKPLSAEQIRNLGGLVDQIPDTALIPSGPGTMRIVNFSKMADHRVFHKAVDQALQKFDSGGITGHERLFASDGELRGNDWKANPNGEDYKTRLSAAGRSDVLRFVSDVLAPKVEAVDKAFAKEHGLRRDERLEKAIRASGSQEGIDLLRGLGRRPKKADGGSVKRDGNFYDAVWRAEQALRRKKADGGPVSDDQVSTPAPPPRSAADTPSYIKPIDEGRRVLSPIGLYSHAAEAAWKQPMMKATPQHFKETLLNMPGVKKDEFKWSGYDQAFAGKNVVTKREVRDHFVKNLPKIEETVKSDDDRVATNYDYDPDSGVTGAPKYEAQTLPGGKNYREVLLHLPAKETPGFETLARQMFGKPYSQLSGQQKAQIHNARVQPDTVYRSSHWDESNVLAHLRMSDRKGANGEKILHLEELQSDWGQEAREKGVHTGNELGPADDAELTRLFNMRPQDRTPEQAARFTALQERGREVGTKQGRVPAAPYIDSTAKWTDLGLKRALHEAAKSGYDKLVITPGEEQAKRYDLSNKVKEIHYSPIAGDLVAHGHDRPNIVSHKGVKPEELAKYIGKEAAERLMAPENKMPGVDLHSLTGDDLKVGGHGMKGYYDTILPKALEKLARQHDPEARVQLHSHALPEGKKSRLDEDLDVMNELVSGPKKSPKLHSLTITPRMRASILAGHKAYAGGGRVSERLHDDIYRKLRKVVDIGGRYPGSSVS